MESSNFIFFKEINSEIYKDIKLAEKKYKENPKATVGLIRSVLEKSFKEFYKDRWNEIEKQNLGNILMNKEFIQNLGITNISIERMNRIRILGNKALHETTSTITEIQALEILECLFYIFKEIYNYSDILFNKDFLLKEEQEEEKIKFEKEIKLIELKKINDEKRLLEERILLNEKKILEDNRLAKEKKLLEERKEIEKKKANEIERILHSQKNKQKLFLFLFISFILIIFKYFYILNKKIDRVQNIDSVAQTIEKPKIENASKVSKKIEDKNTDEQLIEIIERSYQNYFEKPEKLDLKSYYFKLDFEKSEEDNISLVNNPLNPYWLKDLEWMNWKSTNSNNFFIGSFKIRNMIPLVFTRQLGWRGLIYKTYLIPPNQNIDTIINYALKNNEIDEVETFLDDTFENIFISDNDIFSFKNIFKYKEGSYILSRNQNNMEDLTHFVVIRLDISPEKIIFEKTFPSFNFSPNLSLDEKTVYSTSKLAILDKELAKVYKKAKQSLTGPREENLIKTQRSFLKNRKELGSNVVAIEELYKLRINKIETELEIETSKTVNTIIDTKLNVLEVLNGTWKAEQYISPKQQISSYVNDRIDQIIEYQYPYINLKKSSNSLDVEKYKIINSKTATTQRLIDEYNKNPDKNHSYTNLPYLPYYTLIKCQNIETKEILTLAYTYNNSGDNELFLAMIKDKDSIFFDLGFEYLESKKIDLVISGSHFKKVLK